MDLVDLWIQIYSSTSAASICCICWTPVTADSASFGLTQRRRELPLRAADAARVRDGQIRLAPRQLTVADVALEFRRD